MSPRPGEQVPGPSGDQCAAMLAARVVLGFQGLVGCSNRCHDTGRVEGSLCTWTFLECGLHL